MKILIPIIGFGRAGGNRVLAELANYWINEGGEVDFLVNEASSIPYFPTNAGIKWVTNSGKIISETERKKRSPRTFSGWINLIGLFKALSGIGRGYDIILANHSLTVWPVAFAKCGMAKKIHYIQAYEPEYYALEKGFKSIILEWLSNKSYEFDIKQICNAPNYIGYKNIRAKEWVPPGINFNIFFPKLENKNFASTQEIVLGCIGRREPAKGIKYVLEAFKSLYEQDQRFRLHVAFGNLPDDWSHPGLKIIYPENDNELGEFYRSLDIMLAPGTVQLGAPHYPVMEAMACGVPVVNTGYLPANENNSWIVEVGSSNSIVSAVIDVISGKDYRYKVVKATKDIAGFGWEPVAKKMTLIMLA
ncbi:MAG: glycosyltransferase family 4 protein [Rhodoferax sp.]